MLYYNEGMGSGRARLAFQVGLAAGLIVLGAALLAFSGLPESDDEQLFAAQAQNVAVLGNFNALQLFGNERLRGTAPGSEPLHPLVGSIFYCLAGLFKAGSLHGVLLANVFATTLTSALLAWIGVRRGFSNPAALAGALLFGLGSFALPYTGTYYREPLAGLLLAGALAAIEFAAGAGRSGRKLAWLACAGLCFVLGVLAKVTFAAVLPFGLAYVFTRRRDVLPGRLFCAALVLLPVGAGAAWFLMRTLLPAEALGRLNWGFVVHLAGALPDIRTDHFWCALGGLFFSPAKGLVWYAPGLLLGWVGIKRSTSRVETLAAWGAALALAAVHARAYNDRWVMVGWAARPLLPVLPWLALACLPALERLLAGGVWQRRLVWELIVLGAFIQIPRLLAGDAAYINWLAGRLGALSTEIHAWSWELAPLWRQWDLIGKIPFSNIAWLRTAQAGQGSAWLVVFLSIGLVVGGIWLYQRTRLEMRIANILMISLLCGACVTPWLAVGMLRGDPLYAPERTDISSALTVLRASAIQPDAILVDAYLDPLWLAAFNWGAFRTEWVGLPPPVESARYASPIYTRREETAVLVNRIAKPPARIWLLEECLSLSDRAEYFDLLKMEEFSETREYFFGQNLPEKGVCLTQFEANKSAP